MYKMNKYPLVVVLIVGGILSGCSSSPNTSDSAGLTSQQRDALLAMLQNQEEHEALIESWEQARPSVMRLVAIDSELKLLIDQLDNLANAPIETEQPDQPIEALTPIVSAETQDNDFDSTTNGQSQSGLNDMYTVQLAAMDSLEKLKATWQQAITRKPNLEQTHVPRYERISISNQDVYRLKTGVFNTKLQALEFCDELGASNIPCFASQYGEAVFEL